MEATYNKKQPLLLVYLRGGLGNQMFQYACGRALAKQYGCSLAVETRIGFISDTVYRRKYELKDLPIVACESRDKSEWRFLIHRVWEKYANRDHRLLSKRWYGRFINESRQSYSDDIKHLNIESGKKHYLYGYWQSHRYFDESAETLFSELAPPKPSLERYIRLGETIAHTDSVALGLRFYEESNVPALHARRGRLKGFDEINSAIFKVRSARPQSVLFVFCTRRFPELQQLHLPKNTVFVTHDDGFEGSINRLWLLSLCRHHIFTNSSFYWWGAWLSARNHKGETQIVLAADNFINEDGIPPEWDLF